MKLTRRNFIQALGGGIVALLARVFGASVADVLEVAEAAEVVRGKVICGSFEPCWSWAAMNGKIVYIDGRKEDDSGDGKTPETAFKTWGRAHQALKAPRDEVVYTVGGG